MGAPPTLKAKDGCVSGIGRQPSGGDPLARLQRIQAAIDRREATLARAAKRDPLGRRRDD